MIDRQHQQFHRRGRMTEQAIPYAAANTADLFEIMQTTRSMRRLKPDPVSNELIRKILEAGVCAPSGGNMQRWRFLLIRDTQIKETVPWHEPGALSATARRGRIFGRAHS
jgi:Nitroreductase family